MRARLACLCLLAACGPIHRDAPPRSADDRLITTERRERGAALVFIDENGQRTGELTSGKHVDSQPAWSPDGDWVVFVSNRGRDSLEKTNLFALRPQEHSDVFPVTKGGSIDRDPVWLPNGQGLIFSSNRAGTFDLWRIDFSPSGIQPKGDPRQLTRGRGHALAPAVSPDGSTVVFMKVNSETGASALWKVASTGGRPTRLTAGPSDATPGFLADGRVVFAAQVRDRSDSDLFVVDLDGHGRRPLIDEPLADQSGPRVTGTLLFATSVFRSKESGKPILASIVVADLASKMPVWLALHDESFVESRIGIAVSPRGVQAGKLQENPPYSLALRQAIARELQDLAEELKRNEANTSP